MRVRFRQQALSPHVSAAKALAYGDADCCRAGKSIRHLEEQVAARRGPAGRDHIRRGVVVEVSPRAQPGHLPGADSISHEVGAGPSMQSLPCSGAPGRRGVSAFPCKRPTAPSPSGVHCGLGESLLGLAGC